ncbi:MULTISPECIES: TAT leader-containing periplasmic protein [Shewanella]|uniref:TAT leader-containing periplasmic protein n=1 Tax=Shewanella TaxID=22 RepID=UPI001C65B0A1|nr:MULTISPECIES: TAT leader-containing periplasmic protein [Shewanella]QYJ74758.1 TAT leader-containing periplasmic protein [Shewanella sp. FJAT-52076]QYK04629.1 TAT leader-containing periplasmic protein [Shewanella zhangzhouensis]
MNRRKFLLTALGGTAALALGVSLYQPQLDVEDDGDKPHRILFSLLMPVLLEGALPEMAVPREAAVNRTLDAIEATISVLPTSQRDELEQLLDLLENRLGLLLLTGNMTPLLLRSPAELASQLESWRQSGLALLNQAYLGLRELVLASFYSCPEHWTLLNYAKPELPGIKS